MIDGGGTENEVEKEGLAAKMAATASYCSSEIYLK